MTVLKAGIVGGAQAGGLESEVGDIVEHSTKLGGI